MICKTFSQIASPRACVRSRVINLSQQSKRFAYLEIIHVLDQLICVECLTRWAQIITMTMIKIMIMIMTMIMIMIMSMTMTMIIYDYVYDYDYDYDYDHDYDYVYDYDYDYDYV